MLDFELIGMIESLKMNGVSALETHLWRLKLADKEDNEEIKRAFDLIADDIYQMNRDFEMIAHKVTRLIAKGEANGRKKQNENNLEK